MPISRFATLAVTSAIVTATLAGCSGSHPPTVAGLIASLPKSATDVAAGPFVVGRIPREHVADTVVQGTTPTSGSSDWCVHEVCASGAFSAWRDLGWSGVGVGPRDAWPKGSYVEVFDAPAPRVDDARKNLLPTGTAIDVAMVPGSRADLALGAAYNAMGTDNGGEEGPARDVWFDRRLVRVGAQDDVLTESYGSDENFPRDVKTLYFEGPHGELGIVRATTNIFFGADIWSRAKSAAARLQASQREAKRQQVSDAELVAVAASVHAASATTFATAANRVAGDRICTLDLQQQDTHDGKLIASGTMTLPDVPTDTGQVWKLLQGHDAAGHASCPRDDTTCPKQLGPCLAWQPTWGDWHPAPDHAVYFEFSSQHGPRLFALAPAVRSLRITSLARAGNETAPITVPTAAGINDVRWAVSPVPAYRVTAIDATGHPLESVRVDLSGP